MSTKRTRVGLAALLALAIAAFAIAPGAQAAKVSAKAQGGPIPPEVPGTPIVSTAFVQKFKLGGKDVRKRQILDVNVTVNGTGNGPNSNQDLRALLVSPKSGAVELPIPNLGSAMVNLEFDDQSILVPCNPYGIVREDCNYLVSGDLGGTTGAMIDELGAALNPTFRGGNPKGTWILYWWDLNSDVVHTALGETTLKVKTGRKD